MIEKTNITLYNDDCLKTMKTLFANSIDSIITDPPYGLKFMGNKWDYNIPNIEIWEECLRILKPGGYLLSFAGTRTQHRMATNIEDAGFEIRDIIAWVYASGFPKSHNISKAIDKLDGNELQSTYIPNNKNNTHGKNWGGGKTDTTIIPITNEAKQWDGWGTALKPAMEMISICRKPLSEKTIAKNILKHGTGGINIDECRVKYKDEKDEQINKKSIQRFNKGNYLKGGEFNKSIKGVIGKTDNNGRWPANFIHDGSEEVEKLFPKGRSACLKNRTESKNKKGIINFLNGKSFAETGINSYNDSGSASRFFYCAKTSNKDRCEYNNHPTVKPIDLMRYLVKLVTQPNGLVLDPFMGSGSTGKACKLEKFNFIGIEIDKNYFKIAEKRINETIIPLSQQTLF